MQEWVSIYETNECDIGTPDIYRLPHVDGLLTGPPDLGRHIHNPNFMFNIFVSFE